MVTNQFISFLHFLFTFYTLKGVYLFYHILFHPDTLPEDSVDPSPPSYNSDNTVTSNKVEGSLTNNEGECLS